MSKKIQIDVVSDVVCPWCFVGKKHLEKAITALPEYDVEVRWHPFQLDPTVPENGVNKKEHYAKKFGSIERYEELSQRVVEAGERAGIKFNFKDIVNIPNTLSLHALIHEADKLGRADELKERFLKAFFEEALDLTKKENILKLTRDFGWDDAFVESVLENKETAYRVTQEIRHYQNLGVTGVPFFIINNKFGLSGAQPPEVFIEALKEVGGPVETSEAEACTIDDPNC